MECMIATKVLLLVIFTLVDGAASFGLHHDDVIRTSPSSPEKNSIDGNDEHSNRRLFLSSMIAASTVLGTSSPAYAVKGAAEYDFEYYMRDLL